MENSFLMGCSRMNLGGGTLVQFEGMSYKRFDYSFIFTSILRFVKPPIDKILGQSRIGH
jgi:hypothetical protein